MNKIVIFGATGDLVLKKIAPALNSLVLEGKLEDTQIIGFSRRDYSTQDYFEFLIEGVKNNQLSEEFKQKLHYVSSHFDEDKGYGELKNLVSADDNVIYYLSVQPSFYDEITDRLRNHNLNFENSKLLVEKPIGTNKREALDIEECLAKSFSEDQIFRIDHYLQKKMVKNMFAFRFYNSMFGASWNNQSIERIKITTIEDFGVENRGDFYDPLGTLRDVGQNHLLEIAAILTMEKPKTFDSAGIRKARAKALKNLTQIKHFDKQVFRAQHEGYKEIEGVKENSDTETYFKLVTQMNHRDWRNVPIVMEAGKSLEELRSQITVEFREDVKKSKSFDNSNQKNKIDFWMKPVQKIDLGFDGLMEGGGSEMNCTVDESEDQKQYVDEYKSVITDALSGENTWFISKDEVLASWDFIDPIEDSFRKNEVELFSYKKGSNKPLVDSEYVDNYFDKPQIKKQIGLIGLGKMGGGIARQLVENGWDVIAQNRSNEKVDEFVDFGGNGAYEIDELIEKLEGPKVIWVMVPSGKAIEETLLGESGLINKLSKGDIVIDAGNSNFNESVKRYKAFKEKGIHFVDAGVSGGPAGARNGACIMIGGDREVFEKIEHIFKDSSLPGGYMFFDGPGAGHFVKMVHNGIEYGMMQAIGEGFEVMKLRDEYNLDVIDIAEVYNRGSVIESSLIGWIYNAYLLHSAELDGISGEVSHSGEGLWTVEAAREMDIPVKVIEDSLQFRIDSEGNPSYTGKVVSALRGQFGGHDVAE